MWNVIFMGTPDFAVGSLQALLEAGQYHIQAVVTQPDRPKGRGQKVVETPVKTFALQHGLPVFQPLKVKEPEFVQKLKEWKPDFIVVAAFGQFLTQSSQPMHALSQTFVFSAGSSSDMHGTIFCPL